MKKIKLLVILLLMTCLTACHKKEEITSNIVKDGKEYVVDNVSFYYPVKYEMTTETSSEIELEYEDTDLSLEINKKSDGNQDAELIELYRLDLEDEGNTIVSNTTITLDNGDSCQEIVYSNSSSKNKCIVAFDEECMIIFTYKASEEKYEDTISTMNSYLYSLTVKEKAEMEESN